MEGESGRSWSAIAVLLVPCPARRVSRRFSCRRRFADAAYTNVLSSGENCISFDSRFPAPQNADLGVFYKDRAGRQGPARHKEENTSARQNQVGEQSAQAVCRHHQYRAAACLRHCTPVEHRRIVQVDLRRRARGRLSQNCFKYLNGFPSA